MRHLDIEGLLMADAMKMARQAFLDDAGSHVPHGFRRSDSVSHLVQMRTVLAAVPWMSNPAIITDARNHARYFVEKFHPEQEDAAIKQLEDEIIFVLAAIRMRRQ